jgi:sugar phosphate isomerase/epimerase
MTIEFGDSETVGNEFAQVSVQFDAEANSPRLRLEDLRTGRVRYLDALELETIIWLPEDHLGGLLDPSHTRWRGEDPGA